MKTTGASEERIEAAIAVLSSEYGYTNLGASNVVGIVCHIVVKPGECVTNVADLRALNEAWLTGGWLPESTSARIAALIGGGDGE